MSYEIKTIEGIGPTFGSKLEAAKIKTTDDLLEAAATPGGRKKLAEVTDFSEKQILSWVNMADLLRVPGVGKEYSELLHAAGVDTIKELRTRRADNLTTKMADVNNEKKLTRAVPAEKTVLGWIEAAKGMDPKISY